MRDVDIWYSKAKKRDKDDDDYENSAASNDSKDRVEVYNNDIYFYSEVKRSNNYQNQCSQKSQ